MEKLTEQQCEVFLAAVRGESFASIGARLSIHNPRTIFDASRARLVLGKGMAPEDSALDDLPFRLDEWRARPDIAEDMLVRHQAACEAAYRAFWQAYGNHAAQTRTREHQRPGLPRQGSNASPVPA